MRFLETLFSVKNSYDKRHKVVIILGIKFKFKRKNRPVIVDTEPNKLKVEFLVTGGLGDFLVNANYIYNFCKYINKNENIKVDVWCNENRKDYLFSFFREKFNFIDECNLYAKRQEKCYDLSINICAHLYILSYNIDKIQRLSPKLYELVLAYNSFQKKYGASWFHYTNIYHYLLAHNKKYVQLPDITGKIGIKKEFNFPVIYPQNEKEILEKFSLNNKVFITLNYGVDKLNKTPQSTKMWQLDKLSDIARRFKERYPNIVLIQLGGISQENRKIRFIDMDFSGKTNLDDIKVLIKNSILHIDCEGGFAHLRNALKAKHPAIVIFGPTNPDLYGYETNINMYQKACPICCDWVFENWQKECLKGDKIASCTNAITADEVFGEASKYLNKVYKEEYSHA